MTHSVRTAAGTGGGRKLAQMSLAGIAALVLAACASAGHAAPSTAADAAEPASGALRIDDPFEKMNRRFFASHQHVDHAVIRPLALGYEHATPRPVREAIHNVITLIGEPAVFANYVVQLRFARAARTLARFAANATFGIGGLMDPATKLGLPHHDNGFGDTLGRYGMAAGPYLFLPLVGPTDFRDAIGKAVDFAVDPVGWGHYDGDAIVRGGVWVIGGMDERARAEPDLQAIENNTDPYASMRSFYLQNREAQIHGNQQIKVEDLPQFDDEPEPPAPAAPAAPAPSPQAASAAAAAAPTAALVGPEPPSASGDVAAFLTPPRPALAAASGPPIEL